MKEQNEKLLAVIKEAMKGELNSITNYKFAADSADDAEVKDFFLERMKEEQRHYNYLLEYYQFFSKEENISEETRQLSDIAHHAQVFTPNFMRRISANQVLFSAISVAILLEKNAMQFYQNQAEKAIAPELRKFFKLMAKWEGIHYDEVMEISKQAEEKYWQMNDFVPF
jgi:rubrerythrin